tara:strand:+ start:494 stop:967 length:474 start_codon:yes stop_codon:yes gene_type:complete
MIISCPSCKKKFEIDANLIPQRGRNLQCGSCLNVWFYKFEQSVFDSKTKEKIKNLEEDKGKNEFKKDINKEISNIEKNNRENRKDKALVKYEKKTKLTFINFIGYFIVLFLSFVALLIILDTFQALLSQIIPNLELILFNFYETLLDIYLFTKDLIK